MLAFRNDEFPGRLTYNTEYAGRIEVCVRFRCNTILVLFVLGAAFCTQAQSLGDVARQVRAEREKSTKPHPKVLTNDDIATPEPEAVPQLRPPRGDAAEAPAAKTEESGRSDAGEGAKLKSGTGAESATKESEKTDRGQEINQEYLEKIAKVRAKIATAQAELSKLQKEQMESTIEFQRTVGASPSIATYEQQQREFNEHIAGLREQLVGLKAELEDSQEAARHAGVPHVYD